MYILGRVHAKQEVPHRRSPARNSMSHSSDRKTIEEFQKKVNPGSSLSVSTAQYQHGGPGLRSFSVALRIWVWVGSLQIFENFIENAIDCKVSRIIYSK